MFGIGFSELIVIFVIALFIVGPNEMPNIAKKLGKFFGAFKKAADDVKKEFELQVNLDEEKRAIDEKYKQLEKEASVTEKKHEDIK